jgi:fructose-1,6-bisphosphatase/inositol monophosphatase family enzyme
MAFLDEMTLPGELTLRMMEAAKAGAMEALRNRAIGLKAHAKSAADGDIVTQGDHASQAVIFTALPAKGMIAGREEVIGFFGEETMHAGYRFPDNASWRWCIDPVDGTKPYYNGEPFWSVSAALQQRNDEGRWESVAGVVYRATAEDMPDCLCGTVYWAEKGRGAYALDVISNHQTRVSMPANIAPMAEFEISPEVSSPASLAYAKQAAALLESRGIATGWRRSICHCVCEMLEGEKAAVIQGVAGPFDWDIAAISVIAREAGVHCSFEPAISVDGQWRYPAIMAWDKTLFDALQAITLTMSA